MTGAAETLRTRRSPAGRHLVTSWEAGPAGTAAPCVVLLPGLGLPSYAVPTVSELGRRSVPAAVLDLPGFRSPGRRTVAPDVGALGDVAAQWVLAHRPDAPVLVAGHSTGASAALTAALALHASGRRVALLLAGPVFTPAQRRLPVLLAAAPTAYRSDSPRQLAGGFGDLARGRSGVLRIIRSGMRDDVERRVARLAAPLALVAGRADTFAPRWWLDRLAAAATASPSVAVHVVPGSHNMPYTFPAELADVVCAELRLITGPAAGRPAEASGSAQRDRLAEAGQVHRHLR